MEQLICKNCWRQEPEIELVLNAAQNKSTICRTCNDMIGKGAGYSDGIYSEEEINDWMISAKSRREAYERSLTTPSQTNIIDKLDAEKYLDKFQKKLIEVDINKVTPNEWNPNRHTPANFQTLLNSIKRFGFNDPVSVRQVIKEVEEYEILDGEHRWQAAKELGFKKIQVINFGEVTREEAMTLTQLLNLRGSDDVLLRAKMLKELKANQVSLFELLPGTEKEKDEELKLLDFDFSQFDKTEEEIQKKKEGDIYKQALRKALELEIILAKIKEDTDDSKLRLAIEQYFTFSKMLKSYIK